MRLGAALAALLLVGCASVRVGGERVSPRPEIELTISTVAKEVGVEPAFFRSLVIMYDDQKWWQNPPGFTITGITHSPYSVWILHDEIRKGPCTDALVHELIHVWRWRTFGDPDNAHATDSWGAANHEGRAVQQLCSLLQKDAH